jgi:NitT/TauT family transport system permease protein
VRRLLPGFGAAAGLVALWAAAALLAARPSLPAPWSTAACLAGLLGRGFGWHLAASLGRIAAALGIGLAIGLPLGILLGLRRRADQLVTPLVYLVFPLPKIAFLPLFILLLGLGEASKIALIATIVVFPMILAARDGIRAIPPELFLAARSLSLTPRSWPRHLILPAILPTVFSALRVCVGIAVSVLFFAENWATEWGLGCFIVNSWAIMRYDELWAGILSMSLLGLGLFGLIDVAERLFCPWRTDQRPPAS